MLDKKQILATILAPNFEQGLLKKSLREIDGRSLLEIAIAGARGSKYIDKLVVACEDADTIAFCKEANIQSYPGFLFDHSEKMVRVDKAGVSMTEVLSEFDYFVVLDVSCPLRVTADIDSSIELCHKGGGQPVVTVSDTNHAIRDLHYVDSERGLIPVFPRTDSVPVVERKIYELNYSALVASNQYLRACGSFFGENTSAYLIPKERSLRVDSKADLAIASSLMEKRFFNVIDGGLNYKRA